MVVVVVMSDPFDDRRDAHSATDAQGDESALEVAAFEFVEDGAQNHGTGGAERVAHGDGSAVDVDLLMRNAQVPHPLEHDGGEGLVEFEQVDVVDGEAG